VSGTDPLGLVPAIREAVGYLTGSDCDGDTLGRALLAVLELEPPPFHEGDDRDLHDLLVGGWQTCHRAVLHAIARELEVPGA
jgi:hypothetical protein